MASQPFFDFGNGVQARIKSMGVISFRVDAATSETEVTDVDEFTTVSVAAHATDKLFAVFISWSLALPAEPNTPRVHIKTFMEFELDDFELVFDLDPDGVTLTPKVAAHTMFFSIAYSTLRGHVHSRLSGTPWARRFPSLRSPDDLLPSKLPSDTPNPKVARTTSKKTRLKAQPKQ